MSKSISWEDAVLSLISNPEKQALVEACYFDLPLKQAAERYRTSEEWQAMRELIGTPRGIAVDVGAGNGVVSYALAKDGWSVIAVEPDPSNLVGAGAIRRLATETQVQIDVREGYGEGLPLKAGEAQLVIARQVLHHASDLAAFAREIVRVLSQGGVMVSTRDHVITGPEQLQPFLDAHPLHHLYGGENAFTVDQYRSALTNAGLVIEQQLNAFDNVINYAPQTHDSIRNEIAARLGPLGKIVNFALKRPVLFKLAMRVLSQIDRRPGRTVSFVCRRG